MRVEFTKHTKGDRVACSWVATPAKRKGVPGSYMPAGRDLPHDLGQYVVEAAAGIPEGFWGLIDRGATFKSTGRTATKPGRAIIREHRAELDASEVTAGIHIETWRAGGHDEVSPHLDRALEQWRSLEPGGRIVFDWPSPVGTVVPTP